MSSTLTGESALCYALDTTNVTKVMVRGPGHPYLEAMPSKGHNDSPVGEMQMDATAHLLLESRSAERAPALTNTVALAGAVL
jgi:hypothetical protein